MLKNKQMYNYCFLILVQTNIVYYMKKQILIQRENKN